MLLKSISKINLYCKCDVIKVKLTNILIVLFAYSVCGSLIIQKTKLI